MRSTSSSASSGDLLPRRKNRNRHSNRIFGVIMPTIGECPAFEHCRAAGASCDVCLALTVPEWKKHVKKVLKRKK